MPPAPLPPQGGTHVMPIQGGKHVDAPWTTAWYTQDQICRAAGSGRSGAATAHLCPPLSCGRLCGMRPHPAGLPKPACSCIKVSRRYDAVQTRDLNHSTCSHAVKVPLVSLPLLLLTYMRSAQR